MTFSFKIQQYHNANLISDKKEDKTMHDFAKAEKQPKE